MFADLLERAIPSVVSDQMLAGGYLPPEQITLLDRWLS